MVSTRGQRYKFTEGERVLCYEPDPTKAKVLYDSKVLEVIENKDRRGRRTVEYLIHFQGWNSSWDRCVSEDFVLKDTEENRQLQRDLAEKSQLQLGAYLYRRERKKPQATGLPAASTNGGPPAKRPRHSGNFEDEASSSSQNENDEVEAEAEGVAEAERVVCEVADEAHESSSGESAANHAPPNNRAQIALHSPLRDRLTFDYHLVVKRGRLSVLPASPCVAEILESFVRWFARAGAWSTPGRRGPDDPTQRPHLMDVSRRLNLLRETADGLRVYFDHILQGYLLYKRELQQYHDLVGRFIDAPEPVIKREREDEESDSGADGSGPEEAAAADGGVEPAGAEESSTPDTLAIKEEIVIKEENDHETVDGPERDPVARQSSSGTEAASDGCGSPASGRDHQEEAESRTDQVQSKQEHLNNHTPAPRAADSVARRLRSHKSSTASCGEGGDYAAASTSHEQEQAAPSSEQPPSGESSCSSCGDAYCRQRAGDQPAADPPPQRNALSQLLEKVSKWTVVPRENTEHLPCRVYGAIHLSRLFVKLPDFLNAIQMPEMKLKLLLQYIDMFVQYLDEHSEWFGESYYTPDSAARTR